MSTFVRFYALCVSEIHYLCALAVDLAFATNRTGVLSTENIGWRLENIVLLELLRRTDRQYQNVFYIKKDKQFEVDFVVCERSQTIELIQVSHHLEAEGTKQYRREVGGLLKGAKLTGCHKLKLVVMEGDRQTLTTEAETVEVVPAAEWLCNGQSYKY